MRWGEDGYRLTAILCPVTMSCVVQQISSVECCGYELIKFSCIKCGLLMCTENWLGSLQVSLPIALLTANDTIRQ